MSAWTWNSRGGDRGTPSSAKVDDPALPRPPTLALSAQLRDGRPVLLIPQELDGVLRFEQEAIPVRFLVAFREGPLDGLHGRPRLLCECVREGPRRRERFAAGGQLVDEAEAD